MTQDRDDVDVDVDLLVLLVDPVAPRPQTKQALLQALAGPWYAPFVRRVAELCEIPAAAAEQLLAAVDDISRWVPGPASGVQAFHIDAGAGLEDAVVGLIRIAPLALFPAHEHIGAEDALVLQGGFRAGDVDVRAGCELLMPAGSQHELRALAEGCLYLGVVRGGLRFADVVVGPEDPRF